ARAGHAATHLSRDGDARPHRPHPCDARHARRRLHGAHRQGASRLMLGRAATVLAAALCIVLVDRGSTRAAEPAAAPAAKPGPPAKGAPAGAGAADPLEFTRDVLTRSNVIVRGPGDRKQKLQQLSDLLRGFLDTNALARLAAGKNLDNRSPAET